MVGGEDDGAAVAPSGVQQLRQVGDIAERPLGAIAFAALVQGVVNGVEHDSDHRRAVGDRAEQGIGEAVPVLTRDISLVEQEGGFAVLVLPKRSEPLFLIGLAADSQLAGEETRSAHPSH